MMETDILKLAMMRASDLEAVTFRNNVAKAWVGVVTQKTPDLLVLRNYRVLHAGLVVGSSDAIGWKSVVVTPEMVGKRVAVFTALETKVPKTGRLSDDQLRFLSAARNAGAFAGVVRQANDVDQLLCFPREAPPLR